MGTLGTHQAQQGPGEHLNALVGSDHPAAF